MAEADSSTKLKKAHDPAARGTKLKSLVRLVFTPLIVLALAAAVAAGLVLVRWAVNVPPLPVTAPVPPSIAVLPFVDLSPAHDQEYLSDGISEEILNMLAKLKGVRVVARASAFGLKNRNLNVNEIGQRLKVQMLLRGSVRRDANRIRITVQFIACRDGSGLWSKTFERGVREVPAIEQEVSQAVSNILKIGPAIPAQASAWDDPLTNDLYLQGLFLSHQHGEEELRASLDFFRLALEKNPQLSQAWTATAKDWIRLSDEFGIPPLEAYPAAQKAVHAALAADPQNAEAHVYSGETKRLLSWDLNGDEAELKRALELDPNCVVAHVFAASLKAWQGTPNDSLGHIEAALRFDPFSPLVGHSEVIMDVANDRLNAALAAAQRMMETDPNYTFFEPDLALVYREQGKLNEALDIYSRLEKSRPQAGLAITYTRLEREDDARKILAELTERTKHQYMAADEIAAVYVALRQNDEAFQWLNRAAEEHSVTLYDTICGRDFLPLRADPRYPELLGRIGLDPKRFLPR